MKKILFLSMVLALSLMLVTAVPVGAHFASTAPTANVSLGQTNALVMDFTIIDNSGDVFIDSDGIATSGAGTEDASPGDALAAFAAGDNVYYDDADTSTDWTAGDSIWVDSDDHATYEASGRSIGGTITLTQDGYSLGTAVTDAFVVVTVTNEDIYWDPDGAGGADTTADLISAGGLTSGTIYTGDQVAAAIKAALEATDLDADDVFAVTYDEATDKFTIDGDAGNTLDGDIAWTNGLSTASATLGYTADDTAIKTTAAISDVAVAFNVVAGTNDDLSVTIDGTAYTDQTVSAGAYTGATLATELQTVVQAATTRSETVTYAADAFTITSVATSTLSETPLDSSVTVAAGTNDIAAGLGLGNVEVNGFVTLVNTTSDEISLNIDGAAQANIDLVTGDTDYDDADTLVTAIQAAMDAAYGAVVATVSWDATNDNLMIKSATTGGSSVVVMTTGTNNARTLIGYSIPTERAGDDVIIGTPTTEVTTGVELPDAFIKYVGSGGYVSGKDVVQDTDTNNIYRDQLNAITLKNTGTAVDTSDISTVKVWAEKGSNANFQSGEDTDLGSAVWDASDSWDLSALTTDIPAAGQRFYVTVDIAAAADVGDTIIMQVPTLADAGTGGAYDAGDEGLFFASTNDIGGITNANTQTIIAAPTGSSVPRRTTIKTSLFGDTTRFLINSRGGIRERIEATSEDGDLTITIPRGTLALDEEGDPLDSLEAELYETPPDPPKKAHIIGLAYDLGPDGAAFDPAITLEYTYDPDDLPEGVNEEDLVLAYYDEDIGEWVELDTTVDPVTNTLTVGVDHFTLFAIIAPAPAPVASPPVLAPAAFTSSSLSISPLEVDVGKTVTISIQVSNTGEEEGSYTITLKVNGIAEETKEITLAGGASGTVTFTTARDKAGIYSVDVDGLTDSFTVKEEEAPPPTAPPPPAPPETKPEMNWPVLGGIIGGVIVVGLLIFFLIRRKMKAA